MTICLVILFIRLKRERKLRFHAEFELEQHKQNFKSDIQRQPIAEKKHGGQKWFINEDEKLSELGVGSALSLDTIRSLIVVIDSSNQIIFANKKACEVLGHCREKILGKNWIYDFIPQDIRLKVKEKVEKFLMEKGEHVQNTELVILNSNKKIRYLNCTLKKLESENGGIEGIICSGEDFTERTEMQKKLRENKQYFKTLVQTIPHGVQEIDLDGKFLFTNKAYNELFGYQEGELIGESLFQKIMPEYQRNRLEAYYQRLIRERPKNPFYTAQGVKANGEIIDVNVHLNYRFDSKNRLIGFITIVSDITELNKKHQELKESENIAKALMMAPTDSVVLLNRYGDILDLNDTTLQGFQIPKEHLLNMSYFDLFPNPLAEQIKNKIDEVLITRKAIRFENESEGVWNDNIVYPISDNKGSVNKIAFLSHDITERKYKERELIVARAKAEEADKIKSEFLANMSHEFRTPMHAILSYSKFGLTRFDKVGQSGLTKYFDRINKSAKRLMVLLNDLLDLANLEAGYKGYQHIKVNLSFLIGIVLREFTFASMEKQISLEFKKPDFNDSIVVDKTKIIQVIRNLISNAIQYSPEGSTIRIEIQKQSDNLKLSIFDNGLGIPQKELEIVFNKFTESSMTKTGAGGKGLGLSISKEIISDHHGEIWAENNPEGGAVLHVILPIYNKVTAETSYSIN